MSVASSSQHQQPPPRKGNYVKVLKNLHTEQLSKVQWKHQQECELLEDLRNFVKQRCAVEKSYGEAMQKISANYLNKKMPPIHEISSSSSSSDPQQWTVWSIWRSLLEETDKLAKAKLAAVEIFQQQIAEDAKHVRQNKLHIAKKNLDLLKVVQSEVQTCVTELDKLKKVYTDDEHLSHDARDKAREAEEKLKKKKGNIFQSISSLQKTSAKLGSRRELCEEKSTQARNAYLLQLASANAHQNRYFHVDLQNVVKTLDGGMYEKVAEYFSVLSRTELITCSASQTSYAKIKEQAQTISRDYDLACFVGAFPILSQHITYEFEPSDNDTIATVDQSHGTSAALAQLGRQYANRAVQETKKIRESSRALHTLQTMRDSGGGGNKTTHDTNAAAAAESSNNDPRDLDMKIDEIKHQLRRSETAKIKAEARLEALRLGGVKVDEFLQDAEGLAALGLMRSSSQLSFRESTGAMEDGSDIGGGSASSGGAASTGSIGGGGGGGGGAGGGGRYVMDDEDDSNAYQEHDDELSNDCEMIAAAAAAEEPENNSSDPLAVDWCSNDGPAAATFRNNDDDYDDEQEESAPLAMSGPGAVIKCIAFYPYTAQNADELSMMENEELEVLLAFSEGDGWVKARNYKGEEGYVPQNYLDLNVDDSLPSSISTSTAAAAEAVQAEDDGCEYDDEYPTQHTSSQSTRAATIAAAHNDDDDDQQQQPNNYNNSSNGHHSQQQQQQYAGHYRHQNSSGSGGGSSRGDHPDMIREEIEPTDELQQLQEAEDVSAYPLEAQISFSSVDYTYGCSANGAVEDDAVVDGDDYADFPAPFDAANATAQLVLGYCRALYDYDATTDEELTFYEGEVIAVMRRSGVEGGSVDDGWWQGKLLPDGPIGVFPSLVVQECGPSGEDLSPSCSRASPAVMYDGAAEEEDDDFAPSPPGSPPIVPTFLLPPERVIITQPTPETEFSPAHQGFDQNATIKDDDAAEENDDVNDEAGAAATAAEVDEELASEMVIIEPATPTEEELEAAAAAIIGNNNNNNNEAPAAAAGGGGRILTDATATTQIVITASTPTVVDDGSISEEEDDEEGREGDSSISQQQQQQQERPTTNSSRGIMSDNSSPPPEPAPTMTAVPPYQHHPAANESSV